MMWRLIIGIILAAWLAGCLTAVLLILHNISGSASDER
jgi:hypothetical protein